MLIPWPQFADEVASRLDAGAREYGQRSFSREPADLIDEVQQELRDVAGWSWVLANRLEAVRQAMAAAELAPDQGAP